MGVLPRVSALLVSLLFASSRGQIETECACPTSGCYLPPPRGQPFDLSTCATIQGNIYVQAGNNVSTLQAINILGNFTIELNAGSNIHLPNLVSILGTLSISGNAKLTAPRLGCVGLPGADVTAIYVRGNPTLSLSNPDGVAVVGSINFYQSQPNLTNTNIRTISGGLQYFQSSPHSFPMLLTINGIMQYSQSGGGVLNFPKLTYFQGISCYESGLVFIMPDLQKIGTEGIQYAVGGSLTNSHLGSLTNLSGTTLNCTRDEPTNQPLIPYCRGNARSPEPFTSVCVQGTGGGGGNIGPIITRYGEKLSAGEDVGITIGALAVAAGLAVVGMYVYRQYSVKSNMDMFGGELI